jgi:hypothetical protein
MKNLTQKQKEILTAIENEFTNINKVTEENDNDLLALINNAVDEKRKKRLELETLDIINIKEIYNCKDRILNLLQPIADKYNFELTIEQSTTSRAKFYIKMICTGYTYKEINGNIYTTTLEGSIEGNEYGLDSKKYYIGSPIPKFYKKYDRLQTEKEFIDFYVNGVINALKTKV